MFALKLRGAAHPRFRADCFYPIREGRDKAQIFADMLLAHPSCRNDSTGRQHDRAAQDGLAHYIDRNPSEAPIDNVMVAYNSQ